jgi:hypothetical protein
MHAVAGLSERELARVRGRLVEFAKELFASMARRISVVGDECYKGRGRPPVVGYRQAPSSLKDLALAAGKKAAVTVIWREGTRGKMSSRFLALRVRPANIELRHATHKADEDLPVRWLVCEWPSHASEPTKYWLSNLPTDTPLNNLVRLAKLLRRLNAAGRIDRSAGIIDATHIRALKGGPDRSVARGSRPPGLKASRDRRHLGCAAGRLGDRG